MKAKSIKGKSTSVIKNALKDCMEDGYVLTLAIAFISKAQDYKAITHLLDENGIKVFGCTTNGEFIDEETEKESAAILLLDMNPDYFQFYFEEYTNKNYREVAKSIAQKAKVQFKNLHF